MNIEDRKQWRRLRYEYYVGARSALMVGNFRVAGILFGYAIETSIKHALIESDFSVETVLHSHNIKELMDVFKSRKLFKKVGVSNDFLRYVNDFFEIRYPSRMKIVATKANKSGRFLLKSIDFLPCYDDFVLQLDEAIFTFTSDIESTIALDALGDICMYNGRMFFHMNFISCARFTEYAKWIPESRLSVESVTEIKKGKEHLWNCKSMLVYDPRTPDKQLDWHPASKFKYPRWTETPQGKLITFSVPVAAMPGDKAKYTPDIL